MTMLGCFIAAAEHTTLAGQADDFGEPSTSPGMIGVAPFTTMFNM